MSGSLRGRLLVATPELRDPNFRRTVVLVLAHADEGVLGVVLNRPSVTPVEQLLPQWQIAVAQPDLLFLGGPVNVDNVIGLADLAIPSSDPENPPILDSVEPIDLHETPASLERPARVVRMFAGSAGWGPRQLEGELDEGAWWVLDGETSDVFTNDPGRLWSRVLRRQPGRLAWFANALGDPEAN